MKQVHVESVLDINIKEFVLDCHSPAFYAFQARVLGFQRKEIEDVWRDESGKTYLKVVTEPNSGEWVPSGLQHKVSHGNDLQFYDYIEIDPALLQAPPYVFNIRGEVPALGEKAKIRTQLSFHEQGPHKTRQVLDATIDIKVPLIGRIASRIVASSLEKTHHNFPNVVRQWNMYKAEMVKRPDGRHELLVGRPIPTEVDWICRALSNACSHFPESSTDNINGVPLVTSPPREAGASSKPQPSSEVQYQAVSSSPENPPPAPTTPLSVQRSSSLPLPSQPSRAFSTATAMYFTASEDLREVVAVPLNGDDDNNLNETIITTVGSSSSEGEGQLVKKRRVSLDNREDNVEVDDNNNTAEEEGSGNAMTEPMDWSPAAGLTPCDESSLYKPSVIEVTPPASAFARESMQPLNAPPTVTSCWEDYHLYTYRDTVFRQFCDQHPNDVRCSNVVSPSLRRIASIAQSVRLVTPTRPPVSAYKTVGVNGLGVANHRLVGNRQGSGHHHGRKSLGTRLRMVFVPCIPVVTEE